MARIWLKRSITGWPLQSCREFYLGQLGIINWADGQKFCPFSFSSRQTAWGISFVPVLLCESAHNYTKQFCVSNISFPQLSFKLCMSPALQAYISVLATSLKYEIGTIMGNLRSLEIVRFYFPYCLHLKQRQVMLSLVEWVLFLLSWCLCKVAWPSGLRRWFKAPVSVEAWVQIPPLPRGQHRAIYRYFYKQSL